MRQTGEIARGQMYSNQLANALTAYSAISDHPDIWVGSRASRRAWRSISTGRRRARAAPCEVHDPRLPTHRQVGARGRARQDARTARRQSRGDAGATANRRASVRDDQGLDGRHALLVSTITSGERGAEPARSGVQPEASNEDHGNRTPDRGAARLIPVRIVIRTTQSGPCYLLAFSG
jgi:hypothetical protein